MEKLNSVVRPLWKTIAVAILFGLGLITWIWGVVFGALTVMIATLGETLEPPEAAREVGKDGELLAPISFGNCWTQTLPKWYRDGGYLTISWADHVRLLRIFRIPHCAHIRVLPKEGLGIDQFKPIRRSKAKWIPWQTLWYVGRMQHVESNHDARDSTTKDTL